MTKRASIRESVVADYAEGHSYAAIAGEYSISRSTVSRIIREAGVERVPTPAKRPLRTCGCGSPTTSQTGVCRLCTVTMAQRVEKGPVGLPPGDWVIDPRRRILVWRAA